MCECMHRLAETYTQGHIRGVQIEANTLAGCRCLSLNSSFHQNGELSIYKSAKPSPKCNGPSAHLTKICLPAIYTHASPVVLQAIRSIKGAFRFVRPFVHREVPTSSPTMQGDKLCGSLSDEAILQFRAPSAEVNSLI